MAEVCTLCSDVTTAGNPSGCRLFIFYGSTLCSGVMTVGNPSGCRLFIFYSRRLISWTSVQQAPRLEPRTLHPGLLATMFGSFAGH